MTTYLVITEETYCHKRTYYVEADTVEEVHEMFELHDHDEDGFEEEELLWRNISAKSISANPTKQQHVINHNFIYACDIKQALQIYDTSPKGNHP